MRTLTGRAPRDAWQRKNLAGTSGPSWPQGHCCPARPCRSPGSPTIPPAAPGLRCRRLVHRAHTSLGALFVFFCVWHAVLNRRALLRHLRGSAALHAVPRQGSPRCVGASRRGPGPRGHPGARADVTRVPSLATRILKALPFGPSPFSARWRSEVIGTRSSTPPSAPQH